MTHRNEGPVPKIAASAWTRLSAESASESEIRPFLIAPGSMSRVQADGVRDELPCTAEWQDDSGAILRRFEIPASGASDAVNDGLGCEETLRIQCTPWIPGAEDLQVVLRDQLPRIEAASGQESEDSGDVKGLTCWQLAAITAENLIDCHVDLIHGLFDDSSDFVDRPDRWQGRLGALCLRSVQDLAAHWSRAGRSDEPRMSLVVRLARELPTLLTQVCQHPRSVLRRERKFEGLDRVREVDSGCLRWLARQPGTTVVERAGTRQQVLAIVRVQSVDTLENRVVRDLLLRAHRACHRYLREHLVGAPAHPRVGAVASFSRLIGRLLRESPIVSADRLVGVPQPNYVLQMDPRYRPLWSAYQQLVRQQQLEDTLWRWRHRLFAEHLQFGVVAALNALADSSLTHGGDVVLQREQNAGCFLDPRTALGPWMLEGAQESAVDLVRVDQLHRHPLVPPRTAGLGPDFVLVRRTASQRVLVGCWSVLDFGLGTDNPSNRLASLQQTVRADASGFHRGLLFQMVPPESNPQKQASRVTEWGNCRCLELAFPIAEQLPLLKEQLRWALEAE